MAIGIFTNKKVVPSDAEVEQAVGPRLGLWQELSDDLCRTYPVQQDLKFMYGKNYGWARRFQINGKLLTSLYPAHEGFKVQINLSLQGIETALSLHPCRNVQQAIANAYPYPEGRWLFIPVDSAEDLQDIKKLLALRVQEKRLLKG